MADADLRGLIRRYSFLVELRVAEPPPWDQPDYVAYDLVTLLESSALIRVGGRVETEAVTHRQSVDDYVESFHSRNGFSRGRLSARRAGEFDHELKTLVARHCADDAVPVSVRARVVWCRPER